MKPYLQLIKFIGIIVPRRLRLDWRQEWEAELHHRESMLKEWNKLNFKSKLDLLIRSIGSFWDALLLQPRRLEDEMFQDIRYGLRMLRKSLVFTSTAILTLAIGIGLNTTVFSIVKAVLINPLPYVEPDRLMHLHQSQTSDDPTFGLVNHPDIMDIKERSRSIERVGLYERAILNFTDGGLPESIYGFALSHELLPALRVQPKMGRFFLPEDEQNGNNQVMILSFETWQRRFASQPDIIGKPISTAEGKYIVIAVMPQGFNFPLGSHVGTSKMITSTYGFWVPLVIKDISRSPTSIQRDLKSIIQLKSGISREHAQTELNTITSQLAHEYPKTNANKVFGIVPLKDYFVRNARQSLILIFIGAGLVILIISANVANLLLARTDMRRKEMAIRQAIGASRLRLIRQSITESLLPVTLGGGVGILIAYFILKVMLNLSLYYAPRYSEARIDISSFIFTITITLISGFLIGIIPALGGSKIELNQAIKQTVDTSLSHHNRLFSYQSLIIVCEISLAIILTLGAGLLLNSFMRMMTINHGFQLNGLMSAVIILPDSKYSKSSEHISFQRKVLESLDKTPGIESASFSTAYPLFAHWESYPLKVEESQISARSEPLSTITHIVSADYLRTMGIQLLRGRTFNIHDTYESQPIALINETTARQFWKDKDPIGKRILLEEENGKIVWREIVGIVNSTRLMITLPQNAEVYIPVEQKPRPLNFLFVRSNSPNAKVSDSIRKAVAFADKDQSVFVTESMNAVLANVISKQRFTLMLLGIFGVISLILAAMGVYGVVSYSITQRTKEIGIRISLGAQNRDLLKMIMSQGMKPVIIGAIIGLVVAGVLSQFLSTLLYNVKATDPVTFAGVFLFLVCISLFACWLPAKKATKIDPLIAIRYE